MISVVEQSRPARKCVAITPSNTVNFTDGPCRAIYVGSGGNLSVVPPEGSAVSIVGALTGHILWIEAIRVDASGTSAQSLVALY